MNYSQSIVVGHTDHEKSDGEECQSSSDEGRGEQDVINPQDA